LKAHPFKVIRFTATLLAAWSALQLAQAQTEEPTPSDEKPEPSILTPDMIFAKERAILRQLTTGDYPFQRGLFENDILVKSKSVRLESGKRVNLIWGRPKKAKLAPAVFVIDVESASLTTAPLRGFFNRSKRKERRERETRYLVNSPFGSNLLGQGFIVAYAIGKDLETLRSARISDWVNMFDQIRDSKEVDENSFFLMSTKEYANLSTYLAGNYSFSGFILEEPHYMLFSRQTHKDIIAQSDELTTDEIWRRTDPSRRSMYQKVFSNIYSPIILIRAEDSPAFHFSEKTLIDTLRTSNTYFETITLERSARNLQSLNTFQGVMDIEPRVRYNAHSISTWLEGMINYLKTNSDTIPIELQKRAIIR
jgi:hypothetical protein|tara:strand:+ start:1538 stop:2635 length:1098 start_codon:yes stop_codon:yes gene_type:complete